MTPQNEVSVFWVPINRDYLFILGVEMWDRFLHRFPQATMSMKPAHFEPKELLNCSIPCLLLEYTLQSEIFGCVPLGSGSVIQHHLDHSTLKEIQ